MMLKSDLCLDKLLPNEPSLKSNVAQLELQKPKSTAELKGKVRYICHG